MAKYQVTVWRDLTYYGITEVEAPDARAAIEKAREEVDDIDMEDCGCGGEPVHCMQAEPVEKEGNTATDEASWESPDNLNRAAMFKAAAAMLAALRTLTCWDDASNAQGTNGDTDWAGLDAAMASARAAIAQAEAAGVTTPAQESAT